MPSQLAVEGDWSNAAFFLTVGALSPKGMKIMGMNPESHQGDRAVLDILRRFGAECVWDGENLLIRRGALRGQGIDAAPQYKRNRIANQSEQVQMVMQEAEYLDDTTLLTLLPNITPDMIPEILARRDAQDNSRFEDGPENAQNSPNQVDDTAEV